MLEHQATLDVLWDCIRDLDERGEQMSANELTVLWERIDQACTELSHVAMRVLKDAAEAGDRDDGRAAS